VSNKKVLFVSKDAHWQRYRNEVLGELTKNYDCEVTVLTCSGIKDYIKETSHLKYKVATNIASFLGGLSLFPYAFYYILKYKPDTVLALPNSSHITELLLSFFCKFTSSKLTYWTHGYDHCRRPAKGFRGLLNKIRVVIIEKCLILADTVIVFSPKGKQYLQQKGIVEERLFVAPNTLNTNKLESNYNSVVLDDVAAFKEEHELIGRTVFLFSGRLRSGKRLERFIEAAQHANNLDKIAVVVIGDGEMRNDWSELCKKVGLHSVFLGEVFDDKYLSIVFKSADWFVMPGYVGLAIVHAFSHGLPILTENISFHSPEIYYLENTINGYIFEEGNGQEWLSFIECISCDSKVQNEMSSNSLKTVQEKASIEIQLAAIANAFGASKRV